MLHVPGRLASTRLPACVHARPAAPFSFRLSPSPASHTRACTSTHALQLASVGRRPASDAFPPSRLSPFRLAFRHPLDPRPLGPCMLVLIAPTFTTRPPSLPQPGNHKTQPRTAEASASPVATRPWRSRMVRRSTIPPGPPPATRPLPAATRVGAEAGTARETDSPGAAAVAAALGPAERIEGTVSCQIIVAGDDADESVDVTHPVRTIRETTCMCLA